MRNDTKLLQLICQESKLEILPEQLNDETKLIDDLQFDSITLINLIAQIEDTCNCIIEYDDIDFSLLETVAGIKTIFDKFADRAK